MNIFQDLAKKKRPFTVLAPMEDVTDTVFRQIVCRLGRPDLFFTEFTSVEGLCSSGSGAVAKRLKFESFEKPVIAQIWGINPENFLKASKIISRMGFDGIDINMGCPVRKIVKSGGCSAMIKTPSLAKEVFMATKEGANGLPVSVKTRIGYENINTNGWISEVLSWRPDALTVHGRTVAELSKVPCHWDEIGVAVKLRDDISPSTVLIGNGDIDSLQMANKYAQIYGVDGVMIGRGIFENPWIFNVNGEDLDTPKERFRILTEHVLLHRVVWGDRYNFNPLKKFFKMYVKGFDGASDIRSQMMELTSIDEVLEFVKGLDIL